MPQAQGADAGRGARTPHMVSRAEREDAGQTRPALEETDARAYAALTKAAEIAMIQNSACMPSPGGGATQSKNGYVKCSDGST